MSSLPANLLQQLQSDTRAIVTEVERLTGTMSNWSGNVVVGTEQDITGLPLYLGAKLWSCDIALHQSRLSSPARYSTLVHEAFHSVSAGLNNLDFQQWRWWEEAVVEQCTRLFRISILASAGLPAPLDARTSYTDKVTLLEALRQRTQQVEQNFYLALLQTPLRDRGMVTLQWIQTVETTKTLRLIEQETLSIRVGLEP